MRQAGADWLRLLAIGKAVLLALGAVLGLTLVVHSARSQDFGYSPQSVKAAFLYHFAGYVDWPDRSDAPLVIGVLGDTGVAEELRRILPGRSIGNRSLRVRELDPNGALTGVDVLFIARAFAPVLQRLANQRHVLIVTDELPDALDNGAIINFVNLDRRIRFEISLRAAENADLKLSSRLLAAALRVRRSEWASPITITGMAARRAGG